MHASVKNAWIDFNKMLEGIVNKPYADVKNLITVGMGNLIDPIAVALALNWVLDADGNAATHSDIVNSWHAVKDNPNCAKLGWRYAAALPENKIHLPQDEIETLIFRKLASNDATMVVRMPDWESRPADAQLAAHSMAWAMGPNFWGKFPRFSTAFRAGDYGAAALECDIAPAMGTITLRNARNRECLMNAANVIIANQDVSVLVWTP